MSRGLVAGLCLLLSAACATADPPSILEQTGTQLRADIEQAYRALQRQHQLDMDISNVIQRYLPAGMSFNDAEAVLRAAGFTVSPRPRPKHAHPQWYYGYAEIKPLHSGLLYSVSVAVVLEPPGPDDYSVLRRANGSLHTVMP